MDSVNLDSSKMLDETGNYCQSLTNYSDFKINEIYQIAFDSEPVDDSSDEAVSDNFGCQPATNDLDHPVELNGAVSIFYDDVFPIVSPIPRSLTDKMNRAKHLAAEAKEDLSQGDQSGENVFSIAHTVEPFKPCLVFTDQVNNACITSQPVACGKLDQRPLGFNRSSRLHAPVKHARFFDFNLSDTICCRLW